MRHTVYKLVSKIEIKSKYFHPVCKNKIYLVAVVFGKVNKKKKKKINWLAKIAFEAIIMLIYNESFVFVNALNVGNKF